MLLGFFTAGSHGCLDRGTAIRHPWASAVLMVPDVLPICVTGPPL